MENRKIVWTVLALEATRTEIEALNEQAETPPGPDQSLLERLESIFDESLESINIADRLARMKDSASNASEHIVNLIIVFVLKTIILPLLLLWLLVVGLKAIAARSTRLSLSST